MTTRWSIMPRSSAMQLRGAGLVSFAVLVAAVLPTAARAQGIVRMARENAAPVDAAAAANAIASPPPLVFNAATLPVSVLDKTLNLNAEQKATIERLQAALQTERQAVFALRSTPAQQVGGSTKGEQGVTNRANVPDTSGAEEKAMRLAEPVAVSTPTQAASEQAEREDFARMQNAEQALAWNEQATVRKIRALLTAEQITQLKTTESDALLFDSVGLPVELLGQIALTPGERTAITTVYKTARRQFQRATRQESRDAVQNDARAQSLAALTPQNRAVAENYLKARPAVQATPAAETQ